MSKHTAPERLPLHIGTIHNMQTAREREDIGQRDITGQYVPDTSMPDFRAVARSENDVLKDVVRRTDRSVVVPGSAAGCRPGDTGTDPIDARISCTAPKTAVQKESLMTTSFCSMSRRTKATATDTDYTKQTTCLAMVKAVVREALAACRLMHAPHAVTRPLSAATWATRGRSAAT